MSNIWIGGSQNGTIDWMHSCGVHFAMNRIVAKFDRWWTVTVFVLFKKKTECAKSLIT